MASLCGIIGCDDLGHPGRPMDIPTTRKLLGNNSGFLRDLGFFSGSSATPWAWVFFDEELSLNIVSLNKSSASQSGFSLI